MKCNPKIMYVVVVDGVFDRAYVLFNSAQGRSYKVKGIVKEVMLYGRDYNGI